MFISKNLFMKTNSFYRYYIYRVYSHFCRQNIETSFESSVIFITLFLILNILTFYVVLMYFFPVLGTIFEVRYSEIYFITLVIGYLFLNQFVIFKKEKWKSYLEYYQRETIAQRRSGTFFLALYHTLSIAIFLAVSIILLGK